MVRERAKMIKRLREDIIDIKRVEDGELVGEQGRRLIDYNL